MYALFTDRWTRCMYYYREVDYVYAIFKQVDPDSDFFPDIDLGAFGGGEQGVSREHLFFKLDGERVVIVDNHSEVFFYADGCLFKYILIHVKQYGCVVALRCHQCYATTHGTGTCYCNSLYHALKMVAVVVVYFIIYHN